jgi:hypothetical protein
MTTERKPHPHAELIKAWADGAEIEQRNTLKWGGRTGFFAVEGNPSWDPDTEYRIKPSEPVEEVFYARYEVKAFFSVRGIDSTQHHTDNLKLTFIDNKLVKAEVLK